MLGVGDDGTSATDLEVRRAEEAGADQAALGEAAWIGVAPEAMRLRSISGAYALYHEKSGKTHIIGEEARAILNTLANGPLTVAAILAQLSLHYDLEVGNADGEAAALVALTSRLRELEHWGLARPLVQ